MQGEEEEGGKKSVDASFVQYDMNGERKVFEKCQQNQKRTSNSKKKLSLKVRKLQSKKAISVTRLDSSSLIRLVSINIWPRLYRIGDTAFLTSPSSSSIIEPNEVGDRKVSFILPTPAPRSCDDSDVLRDRVPTTLRRKLESDVFTDSRLWGGSPEEGVVVVVVNSS